MAKAGVNSLNPIQKEAQYLKKKMITQRISGIITCLLALTSIGVYYFEIINGWMCVIVLTYCLGSVFTANSFIQDIKVGNPWQRVNSICSIAFYVLTVGLIIYGFVTHNLELQF